MNLFEPKEAQLFDDEEIGAGIPKRASLGHIYRLGKHILMCGDSTDTSQVNALMGGGISGYGIHRPPPMVSQLVIRIKCLIN